MSDSIVQEFGRYLGGLTDDAKRSQAIARAKMLGMKAAPEEAFEAPISTLGDYLDTPIPIPPSLVWPTIVVRGEISATLGRAGKGKTTVNINRILKWAAGKPLFDDFKDRDGETYLMPSHPLKTLIIENEGSAGMFHHKLGLLVNNCGDLLTDDDRLLIRENVLIWGDGGFSGLKLDNDPDLNKVRAGCEKWQPDIVFIEPFRGLWSGEENSSTDMAKVIDNVLGLATDFQCGVVLSHHERKSGAGEDGELMSAGRGSTVLEGAVALMENFQSVKGGDFREMTWSKARYLPAPPPVRLQWQRETGWYRHVAGDEIESAVLQIISESADEPITKREIAEELNESQAKIAPHLKNLTEEKRIVRMKGVSDGMGSTGYRYRLATGDAGGGEGLGF